MNKITAQVNGVTFTVETDSTALSIAGVEFKFMVAPAFAPVPAAVTGDCRAFFPRNYDNTSTIDCIRAMRIALNGTKKGNMLTLRDLKEMVETHKVFEIPASNFEEFEAFCNKVNLAPTYV